MPSKAIGTSLNYGFPGEFSRNGDCVIKSRPVKLTDTVNINFGDVVITNPDSQGGSCSSVQGYIAAGGTVTAAKIGGIAVRNVKQFSDYNNQSGIGQYLPGQWADYLERGSGSVKCNVGTPVSQGQVYVRIAANGSIPAGVVGGIEAAADGSNTVAIPGCLFHTGLIDVNGVTEITILNRLAA